MKLDLENVPQCPQCSAPLLLGTDVCSTTTEATGVTEIRCPECREWVAVPYGTFSLLTLLPTPEPDYSLSGREPDEIRKFFLNAPKKK